MFFFVVAVVAVVAVVGLVDALVFVLSHWLVLLL